MCTVPEQSRPLGSLQGIVFTFPSARDRGGAQSEPLLRTASLKELPEEQFCECIPSPDYRTAREVSLPRLWSSEQGPVQNAADQAMVGLFKRKFQEDG